MSSRGVDGGAGAGVFTIFFIGLTTCIVIFILLALAHKAFAQDSTPAPPIDREKCGTVERFLSTTGAKHGVKGFHALEGDAAVRAKELFNAYPPETETEWDNAWLGEDEKGGVLAMGLGGKVCALLPLRGREWQAVVNELEGSPT